MQRLKYFKILRKFICSISNGVFSLLVLLKQFKTMSSLLSPISIYSLISLLPLISFSQIIEVKQDGTGSYTTIQDAVNSATEGDTVLIWPGTYYENVDMLGKSISLASLALTTGDVNYKYSTIINGNKTGTCILVIGSLHATIYGLTLTNGSGYMPESLWDSLTYGGGIYSDESYLNIKNCIIRNNKVNTTGGGALFIRSNIHLSGTNIINNWSTDGGGGILIALDCIINFDSINRCNISANASSHSCDIGINNLENPFTLFADTFSVLNPGRYFLQANDLEGYPNDDFINLNILHQKITPYDGDLYVDPLIGNDTNSGTNINQPLKTIFTALSKIVEDSINKNIIHLANGVYSDTANGEKFPLNVRSNVIMQGESMAGVIWDGRDSYRFLRGNNLTRGYEFKNITMHRGKHKFRKDAGTFLFYLENTDILLDSITVTESSGYSVVANLISCSNAVIKNSVFSNNKGGNSALVAALGNNNPKNSYSIINCKFMDNMPDYDNPEYPGGGGLSVSATIISPEFDNPSSVINCLISGNNDNGFDSYGKHRVYLINNTLVNNCLVETGGVLPFTRGADGNIYNCIVYNNGDIPIYVSNWETSDTAHLNIYNSLIDGGEESITVGEKGVYYYDSTNIDADPNFLGLWGDPYMIADGSPCIDAGTLANLPDFIELPEFDLAGNPRIVGDSIDMGAYEWNPTIVGFNEIGPGNRNTKPKLLKASPNPFDWGTYLSVDSEYSGEAEVKVEVYDNYGRLVRNILTTNIPGKQEILWYGDDNNGNPLPAGIYHIVLFSGEREIESLKVVKR